MQGIAQLHSFSNAICRHVIVAEKFIPFDLVAVDNMGYFSVGFCLRVFIIYVFPGGRL